MKKLKFLLLGTSLSFLPTLVYSQCVPIQDCAALGYTETSCSGGKGVKCPFGNGWFCGGDEESICRENGFTESCNGTGQSGSGSSCGGLYAECSCESTYQYTCTGTGYAGGAGSACGGKYMQCTCSSSYEWKNGSCQQQVLNGAQGDLYYCNGAVVAVKTSDMDFYIALNELGPIVWKEADNSCQTYSFCGNIKGSLPSIEQMLKIYKQKDLMNNLLIEYKGKLMEERYYFSISPYGETTQNVVDMSNGETGPFLGVVRGYVRPVLTSW